MTVIEGAPVRAGFWRRFGALLIDSIVAAVLLIPIQVLIAVLFLQTNGAIQGNLGLAFPSCETVNQLPPTLEPSPPADFTLSVDCTESFFGLHASRALTVVKIEQGNGKTSMLSWNYSLGPDGHQVDAFYVSWVGGLVFFAYLVLMETWRGATVGKQVLNIRTVDVQSPSTVGLPLRKAVARQLAMMIGLIPAFVPAFWWGDPFFANGADISETLSTSYIATTAITGVIEIAWFIWIIVSVSKKRDPIYDRIAGTSVLRTS
ncbi:RDD family protein [Aminobacter sp. AP02]|uniref:RDD family protein n=1 Tax=Aminobacter sp. AP02 TaxID=2135737 RepID=UPI000D6C4C99|nr:RDD family protein [Aminobacter sp. AP02]PWK63528.1 RDD family protein [Aminobacter sp. AP02]